MTIILGIFGGLLVFWLGFIIGKVAGTPELPECCLKCLHYHNHRCLNLPPYICCDHFEYESRMERQNRMWKDIGYTRGYADGRKAEFESSRFEMDKFRSYTDQEKFAKKLEEAVKPLDKLRSNLK